LSNHLELTFHMVLGQSNVNVKGGVDMCELCSVGDRSSTSSGRRNRCNKCVCDILRKLDRGTEVDVFLSGGAVLEDVIFLNFDNNNCCAKFRDEEEEPGTIIFVDCRDIQALRIE